jgi:DNA-directed RNA polymerase specialized sigma24 family protein
MDKMKGGSAAGRTWGSAEDVAQESFIKARLNLINFEVDNNHFHLLS